MNNKNDFAYEIHISWLYYGDIKIRDTLVYDYTPREGSAWRRE